jgi:hypothetical protein
MNIQEVGRGMDGIDLDQNWAMGRAVVSAVVKLRVS